MGKSGNSVQITFENNVTSKSINSMLRTIDVKQTFFPLIYFGLKFLMSMFFTGPVRLTHVLTNTCTEIPDMG